jgi:tetratricopeptide (TPR) repeat protein
MTEGTAPVRALMDRISTLKDPHSIISAVDESVATTEQDRNSLLWANFNGYLGASLVASASGAFDEELIARILTAYETALSIFDPRDHPGMWLTTQRNFGATHALAVKYGVGDPKEHVEAGIIAYEKAIEFGHREAAPPIWLECHQELIQMLFVSVKWRGPAALLLAARICEEALEVITPETSPDVWAGLKVDLGRCLFESGQASEESREKAIRSCNDALQVLQPDRHHSTWAMANLVLGGAYRGRVGGDRDQNLDRATTCLDLALSMYSEESTPYEWYCVHYQRGPAYAYRLHGDRQENQERALESLKISIRGAPREQDPTTWASLQLVLGEVYRERLKGDGENNSRRAIIAFKLAAETLRCQSAPALWLRAKRSLALEYLAKGSDLAENIESAIKIFDEELTVLSSDNEVDNKGDWCITCVNMALAYLIRGLGDRGSNQARAIECLERALALPIASWNESIDWQFAQSLLAQLLLLSDKFPSPDELRRQGWLRGVSRAGGKTRFDCITGDMKRSDIFDLGRLAQKEYDSFEKELASGNSTEDLSFDYHIPFMLNSETYLLATEFFRFLENRRVWQRTVKERAELERGRLWLSMAILEHFIFKYRVACETRSMFRWTEKGLTGFVLFLRGFSLRVHYHAGFSYGEATEFNEQMENVRLAQKLAPIPLLLVGNPADSMPLDAVISKIYRIKDKPETSPFLVAAGTDWESKVKSLISLASFIVVHNPVMTAGVTREIQLVEEAGRRKDTYFYAPDKAAAALGVDMANCALMNDEAVGRMRILTRGRCWQAGCFPEPSCLWVTGAHRTRLEFEHEALRRWIERLTEAKPALVLDLRLDASDALLANSLLLEKIELVPPIMLEVSEILRSFGEEHLQDAESIAQKYEFVARELEEALAQSLPNATVMERNMRVVEILRGNCQSI